MAAANRDRGRRPPVVAVKRGKKKIQEKNILESPGVKLWKDQSAIVLQKRGTAMGLRGRRCGVGTGARAEPPPQGSSLPQPALPRSGAVSAGDAASQRSEERIGERKENKQQHKTPSPKQNLEE